VREDGRCEVLGFVGSDQVFGMLQAIFKQATLAAAPRKGWPLRA
jgi:hypothetical protein